MSSVANLDLRVDVVMEQRLKEVQRKEMKLTYAATLKLIRSLKGKTLFISVNVNAPDAMNSATHYFPLYGNLEVTKPQLRRFLENVYRGRWENDALVRVTDLGTCIFFCGGG